jgi:hypothetical protein
MVYIRRNVHYDFYSHLLSLFRRRFSESLADGIAVSMSQYGRTTDRTQEHTPNILLMVISLKVFCVLFL